MRSRLSVSRAVGAIAFGATLVLGLSSCAAGSPDETDAQTDTSGAGEDKQISILWVQPLFTHPVHKIMQAGFIAACKDLDYKCDLVGNPSATSYDITASIALAEAAIAKTSYDAIAVYGADPGLNSYMEKLGNLGYPIVTWHVLPEEGTVPGLLAAAAQDIAEGGKNAALALGAEIQGQGTVAITQGSSNTSENLMTESFTATMNSEYPDVKILETVMEGFDPVAAQQKAIGLIQANPDIVGAFSTTGGGPATWAGAQRTSGVKLTIIGMDYTRQNLDLVTAGEVFAVLAQPLYSESRKVAELAGALARGESVDYINLLPSPVIKAGDLEPYYDILDQAEAAN